VINEYSTALDHVERKTLIRLDYLNYRLSDHMTNGKLIEHVGVMVSQICDD